MRFAIRTIVVTAAVIGGLRVLFGTVLARPYEKGQAVLSMTLIGEPARLVPHQAGEMTGPETGPVLDAIRRRGWIRVCQTPDAMPFAYTNARGEFIGHDVDLAHMLAHELDVGVEFVPITRSTFESSLHDGVCDIAMSGIPVTTTIARAVLLSNSYLSETLAFVVPDAERHGFRTWDDVRQRRSLTVASVDIPYFVDKFKAMVPNGHVVTVGSVAELFQFEAHGADAALLTAERGSVWTMLHPELSVVVPQPDPMRVPLAFGIARRDVELAAFVNSWIELKREDGTLDRLYKHWILGTDAVRRPPRWSILRDVLHWVR